MPKIDALIESISQTITNYQIESNGKIFLSTIDLNMLMARMPFECVDMTCTYRFNTSFFWIHRCACQVPQSRES